MFCSAVLARKKEKKPEFDQEKETEGGNERKYPEMDSFAITHRRLVSSETDANVSRDACRRRTTIKKLL